MFSFLFAGNKLTTRKRSDISIGKKVSYNPNAIYSSVTIYNSKMSDTGTYVCRSSDLQTESFAVEVLNGKSAFLFVVLCQKKQWVDSEQIPAVVVLLKNM